MPARGAFAKSAPRKSLVRPQGSSEGARECERMPENARRPKTPASASKCRLRATRPTSGVTSDPPSKRQRARQVDDHVQNDAQPEHRVAPNALWQNENRCAQKGSSAKQRLTRPPANRRRLGEGPPASWSQTAPYGTRGAGFAPLRAPRTRRNPRSRKPRDLPTRRIGRPECHRVRFVTNLRTRLRPPPLNHRRPCRPPRKAPHYVPFAAAMNLARRQAPCLYNGCSEENEASEGA